MNSSQKRSPRKALESQRVKSSPVHVLLPSDSTEQSFHTQALSTCADKALGLCASWDGYILAGNTGQQLHPGYHFCLPNDIMLKRSNNKGAKQVDLNLWPWLSPPEKRVVASRLIQFLRWASGYSLNQRPSHYKQSGMISLRQQGLRTPILCPRAAVISVPVICLIALCCSGALLLLGNQLTPGKGANGAGVALWELWVEGRVCHSHFQG